MRVLLIGETDGRLDEGMKNTSRHLFEQLKNRRRVCVKAIAPSLVLMSTPAVASWAPDIVHYVHGPSSRGLTQLKWLKVSCPPCRTVASFTHPGLGRIGMKVLKAWPPDLALVQSRRWLQVLRDARLPTLFFPLSGVDLHRFRPVSADGKLEQKRGLGFPMGQRIVLHIGPVKANRNLEALLSLQALPEVQVVILRSTAAPIDGRLLRKLTASGIIVHAAFVPNVEVYYQAADCYVFPTEEPDGAVEIPLSVLEAMATNLPVITTAFGGLPSLFDPGTGLFFLENTSWSDLQWLVRAALDSREIGTRDLVSGCSWQDVTSRVLGLYHGLLADEGADEN